MKKGKKQAGFCSRFAALLLAILLTATCCSGLSSVSYAAGSNARVSTNGANLNVRSGPSTNYKIVAKLKNGTQVKVKASSGGWYKIEYTSGKNGYISGQYLNFSGSTSGNGSYPVTAQVTNGTVPLNLRKRATTSSSVLAKIPRGSKIKITGKHSSEWYSANYSGKKGYVYSSYVVMQGNSGGSSSGSTSSASPKYKYTKINLNVPLYSQFDSRWADHKLGNTSYTIRQCGCVVCGLSEIESYLQGKQITPAAMVKRLSFDKEGNVYWPSGYTAYNKSDYLSKIYQQLKKGNPVLLGGRTSAGKQHWIVVTGYKANTNSLSESNFIVKDCSDRYSTLSAYQNKYSKFYKIVYKVK